MQVPNAVTLTALRKPLNASTNILQFAIRSARQGRATVLDLADGQAGADSVAVLPLQDGEVLLLGLEPHGGASKGPTSEQRHAGHPQGKRSVFWQGLPSAIQEEKDVWVALLYITHDELVDKTGVLEKEWNSTVLRDCNSSSDVVNLLLMDRSGLQFFFGPLWPCMLKCVHGTLRANSVDAIPESLVRFVCFSSLYTTQRGFLRMRLNKLFSYLRLLHRYSR